MIKHLLKLLPQEIEAADKWVNSHTSCKKEEGGGGDIAIASWYLKLQSNSMASTCKVICNCGDEFDATDYGSW